MHSGIFPEGDFHAHAHPDDPDDDADLEDYPDGKPPHPTLFGVRPDSAPHSGRHPMRSHHTAIGVCCLHCGSSRTTTSNLGRRIGSAVGTLAGAATATARTAGGAQLGAELGAVLGAPAGPVGTTVGGDCRGSPRRHGGRCRRLRYRRSPGGSHRRQDPAQPPLPGVRPKFQHRRLLASAADCCCI